MENENLVAAMAEKAKRLECEGPVQQQIRDKYNQTPTAQLPDYPPQRGFRRGAATGLGGRQHLEQLVPVAEPRPGRRDGTHVVIERDQPGGIALPDQHQG